MLCFRRYLLTFWNIDWRLGLIIFVLSFFWERRFFSVFGMAFCSRTLDWTETDIYTAILHLLHKHNEQLELKTQKPKIQNNLVNHILGDIKGLESKKLTIEQSSKRPIGFQHWRLLWYCLGSPTRETESIQTMMRKICLILKPERCLL